MRKEIFTKGIFNIGQRRIIYKSIVNIDKRTPRIIFFREKVKSEVISVSYIVSVSNV